MKLVKLITLSPVTVGDPVVPSSATTATDTGPSQVNRDSLAVVIPVGGIGIG